MAALIGATCDLHRVSRAWEYLLLFDRIACSAAAIGLHPHHGVLSRLHDDGILFTAPVPASPLPEVAEWDSARRRLHHRLLQFAGNPETSGFAVTDLAARTLAIHLHGVAGCNAVPITSTAWRRIRPVILTNVLELVVKDLPVPAPTESLDTVLELRNDLRSRGLADALRAWMSDAACARITGSEVSGTLQDVIVRYDAALRRLKVRRDAGTVHALVAARDDAAEALVSYPWSKASLKQFGVNRKRIGLMKSEMRPPGCEVAYIVASRDPRLLAGSRLTDGLL